MKFIKNLHAVHLHTYITYIAFSLLFSKNEQNGLGVSTFDT